jgi:superfamily II DNA or RNA helicase
MLRLFQQELIDMVKVIRDGNSPIRDIFGDITPGGGKGAIGPLLLSLLPKIADKICWVVPRRSLAQQAEEVFQKPLFRSLFGLSKTIEKSNTIRWSDNTANPSRGHAGYVTLYQSIGANPDLHRQEFYRHRYILFLDEPHHVALGSSWHHALQPLVDHAVLRVYASGTFERGDKGVIGLIPYALRQDGTWFTDFPRGQTLTYHRREALAEGAIVPLYFDVRDGAAEWTDAKGKEIKIESFEEAALESREMLRVVLQTEYARSLLHRTIDHWRAHKKHWPPAKLLIVSPFIGVGRLYAQWILEDLNIHVPVVSSHDESATALKTINRFKQTGPSAYDALITCQMAYEGLDVPQITHVACLTRYRTAPWLYQCFARACRTAPGKHGGYVFAPDDPDMQAVIRIIKQEQFGFAEDQDEPENGGHGGGGVMQPIIPLQSQMTTGRAHDFEEELDAQQTHDIEQIMIRNGLNGYSPLQVKRAFIEWSTMQAPEIVHEENNLDMQGLTPSQQEVKLRQALSQRERLINQHYHGGQWGTVENELYRRIQKQRNLWSLEELEEAWVYLCARYPLHAEQDTP